MLPIEMFETIRFLQDSGIEYRTEGRDVAEGWIGIKCPFCLTPDPEFHLGINVSNSDYPRNIISCFRCGKKGNIITLVKKLRTCNLSDFPTCKNSSMNVDSYFNFESSLRSSGLPQSMVWDDAALTFRNFQQTKHEKCQKFVFPDGTSRNFHKQHLDFLRYRRYDPDAVIPMYDVRAYFDRLLFPVRAEGEAVTYVTRTTNIEGKGDYRACSKKNSRMFSKECLYELDRVRNRVCLVVEGIFDVWRMGPGAVCTFGVQWTREQLFLLVRTCDRVFVLFDTEPEAQEKADRLVWSLNSLGTESVRLELPEDVPDPDSLSDDDAKNMRKTIFSGLA